MKNNRSWSALLVGMFITMIIVIIAVYLLDKIVPFSRDIKGVENGNIAYYKANTAINEALFSMSGADSSTEGAGGFLANGSGSLYTITANGTILPQLWQGNSEYDTNWAILGPGKPIQLVLKSSNAIDWISSSFTFRIPDLDKNGTAETLSGTTTPILHWILSASGETLQASGSQIMANEINGTNSWFSNRQGLSLSGDNFTFGSFYSSYCSPVPKLCTLKFSLVNPLVLSSGETAPYIEYQAHFNTSVPLQTAVVETQGYAGGFRKNITRYIQQTTINEALDFTVFQ